MKNDPKKLFCIIEEDSVRMFFKTLLEEAGWEVYCLPDLSEADFRIPEFLPDVIILDTAIVAPQRDEMKSWDMGKAKVLGLGFIGEKELWGTEIDAFLAKPLSPLNLVDKILELV